MSKLRLIALALVILVSGYGCATKQKPATGADDEIVVIADAENWRVVQSYLEEAFGKTVYTPQNEVLYTFKWVVPGDFKIYYRRKNVILVGRLEVSSSLTPILKSMLPDTLLQRIFKSPGAYYSRRNAYADGQLLMVFLGQTDQDLQARIRLNQEALLARMEQVTQDRMTRFIYRIGEQTEMTKQFYNKYGWSMRIMHDYLVLKDDPKNDLVWLGRDYPFRWVAVHWETPPDSFDLAVLGKRMLEKVWGGLIPDVRLSMKYFDMRETWLNNFNALEYRGLWVHKTEVKGGPFIAYALYAPRQDKVFLLTGLVWAPDRAKLPYIRQIEMILKTFNLDLPKPN